MKANKKVSLQNDKKANLAMVMGLVMLLLTIVIGLLVFWEINTAISIDKLPGSGSDAWNTTNDTAGTVFSLLPIVGIIMIAGIMLYYISRFGGGV